MKRLGTILIAFVLLAFAASCSKERKEEKAVAKVVERFYEYMNERDFKAISRICSPQMRKHVEMLETFGEDLVIHKQWSVEKVDISGNRAVARVVATDSFDNKNACVWNLTKQNETWLLDMVDFSSADALGEKPKAKEAAAKGEAQSAESPTLEAEPAAE